MNIDLPDLMTTTEAIVYLRLNADDRDPTERLRNLIRRQGLPQIRRGKLRLFRRSAIDAWLDRTK
jgi:excisionase family DNA binding protein